MFTFEDECCSVEKERLTALLGPWIWFGDCCEPCFFLFEGGIESDLTSAHPPLLTIR